MARYTQTQHITNQFMLMSLFKKFIEYEWNSNQNKNNSLYVTEEIKDKEGNKNTQTKVIKEEGKSIYIHYKTKI